MGPVFVTGLAGCLRWRAGVTIRTRLFEEVHVHALVESPERKEIEAAIDALATSKTGPKPGDVFILFASGHGGTVQCAGETKAGYRLLGRSATASNPATLCAEGIPQAFLTARLRAIRSKKKLLILDTCSSGDVVRGNALVAMRGAQHVEVIRRLARSEGLAVIAASRGDEAAYEVSELGHGLLTHSLLTGLESEAAAGEPYVTLTSLAGHVNASVPALARRYSGTFQYPTTAIEGDFPLFARSPGAPPLVKGRSTAEGLAEMEKGAIRDHIKAKSKKLLLCDAAPSEFAVRAVVSKDGKVRFEPAGSGFPAESVDCMVDVLGTLKVSEGRAGTVVQVVGD